MPTSAVYKNCNYVCGPANDQGSLHITVLNALLHAIRVKRFGPETQSCNAVCCSAWCHTPPRELAK